MRILYFVLGPPTRGGSVNVAYFHALHRTSFTACAPRLTRTIKRCGEQRKSIERNINDLTFSFSDVTDYHLFVGRFLVVVAQRRTLSKRSQLH